MACKDYPRIKLTHANLKQPVTIMVDNIDFYFYSENQKATVVAMSGQNMFPAIETAEQIDQLVDQLLKEEI